MKKCDVCQCHVTEEDAINCRGHTVCPDLECLNEEDELEKEMEVDLKKAA